MRRRQYNATVQLESVKEPGAVGRVSDDGGAFVSCRTARRETPPALLGLNDRDASGELLKLHGTRAMTRGRRAKSVAKYDKQHFSCQPLQHRPHEPQTPC